jgi:hypothetical protein
MLSVAAAILVVAVEVDFMAVAAAVSTVVEAAASQEVEAVSVAAGHQAVVFHGAAAVSVVRREASLLPVAFHQE